MRIDIKQTHDFWITYWITMFHYSKAHQSKQLSLSLSQKLQNDYPCLKLPYNALQALEH